MDDSSTGDETRDLFRNRTGNWQSFVQHYWHTIRDYCVYSQGLNDSDAEELTQVVIYELFLCLRKNLAAWNPDVDGPFHAWLKRVVINELRSIHRKRHRRRRLLEKHVPLVQNVVDGVVDAIALKEIITKALELTKSRVSANHWRAFMMSKLEDRTATEIAAELGLKDAKVVHTYVWEVKKIFEAELKRLMGEGEMPS